MSTELIKRAANTGLTALATGADALMQAATSAGVAGASGKRLSHSGKTGEWKLAGQLVDEGKAFVFDMLGVRIQWMAWKDQKPVANLTEKLIGGNPLPAEVDLEDYWGGRKKGSDGWQKNLVFDIIDADTGEQFEVNLKADSDYRPACRLITEYANKVKVQKDEAGDDKMPIIEIGDNKFFAKAANEWLHAPTLKIVDWISQTEVSQIIEAGEVARGQAGDMGAYADEAPAAVAEPESAPATRPAPAVRTGRRV